MHVNEWRCVYFVANRFGSMQEKQRRFPGTLSRQDVSFKVSTHLDLLRTAGHAVYPGFDLEQITRAA